MAASCNLIVGNSYCIEQNYGVPPITTTSSAPVSTTTPGNGVSTPTPVQSGIASNCNKFYLVKSGDGCEAVATANGISLSDFYLWNPAVGSTCRFLQVDVYVCVAIIGGTTQTPSPTPTNGISTPSPIQTGMVTNCNKFYFVKSGDGCEAIATANGVSLTNFYAWNPAVGSTCRSLQADVYVCIGIVGASTSTPAPTPTNGITTPSPIQTGMVTNCNGFYLVKSGDGCEAIATSNGITLTQFYAWNPAVGSTCRSLQADVYVCVKIVGGTTSTPSPTPTNGVTTPSPIQTGMVTNCNTFYLVKSGDDCDRVASLYGITFANLYAWNPAIGSTCAALQLGTYVCVKTIGFVGPTTTTTPAPATTSAGNGITTPLPTQPGMVSNCDAFEWVDAGETCASIAAARGASVPDLIRFNPGVKSDCSGIWANVYLCVSIVGHTLTTSVGNGVTTPTPIQTGMVTNCKTFEFVDANEDCTKIAAARGISVANFIKWNPAVGSNCAGLWSQTWACVGVI